MVDPPMCRDVALELYEALNEVVLEVEFLLDRYAAAGTSSRVLARARRALAAARREPADG